MPHPIFVLCPLSSTKSFHLGKTSLKVASSYETEKLDSTDIRSETINQDGHVGNSERTVGDFLSIPPRPLTSRDKVQTILNNKPEVLTGKPIVPCNDDSGQG
jgi:hypothetical protein